jgi:hypothetical protein
VEAADEGCARDDFQFYIGVLGATSASFSLLANMLQNGTVPQLVPGMALGGTLAHLQVDYYFLRPDPHTEGFDDIRLLLTVLQVGVICHMSYVICHCHRIT